MGRKNNVYYDVIESAKSLASSFTTTEFNVESVDNVGFIISTSGVTANTGTFVIQKRYQAKDNPVNVTSWANVGSTLVLANANAVAELTINQTVPCQLRISFTPGGGSPNGTCAITMAATSLS